MQKLSGSNGSKAIYVRILLYMIILIVATSFVMSSILFFSFQNITQNQVFSYTVNNLDQAEQSVNYMNTTAKNLLLQIAYDSYISKLLFYNELDYVDVNIALTQLNSYSLSKPLVSSIYVYDPKSKTFYSAGESVPNAIQSKGDFFDKGIVDIVDHYMNYKNFVPIPREVPNGLLKVSTNAQIYTPSYVYTYVFYDQLDMENTIGNMIFLNLSQDWLDNTIGGLKNKAGNMTLIVDETGKVVFKNKTDSLFKEDLNEDQLWSIVNSTELSGYLVSDVSGIKSFVAYSSSESSKWKYISITPYDIVIRDINRMRMITAVVIFSILLAGLIFAYILSKKLYTPIDKIHSSLKTLEAEKRQNSVNHKQQVLRTLLLEYNPLTLENIQEVFAKEDIALNPSGHFVLLMLKIDHYSRFTDQYHYSDRNLFKFAIMNICTEICSEDYLAQAVDMDDDRIVMILNTDEYKSIEFNDKFQDMLCYIQAAIEKHLQISISVAVSSAGSGATLINNLYHEAAQTSFYRLFRGHQCIIYFSEINDYKDNKYVYPVHMEKQLLESLMLGNVNDAKEIFNKILEDMSKYSYITVQMAFSHLIFNIDKTIDTIQRNNFPGLPNPLNINILSLTGIETTHELYQKIFTLFDSITERLQQKKDAKYEDLISKVLEIIHNQYANQMLSVDFIADNLSLSPTYLGRLFRRHTSKSILEYINEARITHAKKLLCATNLSIAEIAVKSGFTNSVYFHKVFKKANGVTPNDYRMNNKRSGESLRSPLIHR